MSFDFKKLNRLNKAIGMVNVEADRVNFEEFRKRADPEIQGFIDDYEIMFSQIKAFKEKYSQIYS